MKFDKFIDMVNKRGIGYTLPEMREGLKLAVDLTKFVEVMRKHFVCKLEYVNDKAKFSLAQIDEITDEKEIETIMDMVIEKPEPLVFKNSNEEYAYYRKKYLDMGGYPIKLTLGEYKEEIKKMEEKK